MKYLKLFDNNTEYQQFIGGEDYVEPHIVVVKNENLYFKNIKKILSFTVDNKKYNFEDGMTWEEFVNSKYNVDYFSINVNNNVYYYNSSTDYGYIRLNYLVKNTDLIKEENYGLTINGGGSN